MRTRKWCIGLVVAAIALAGCSSPGDDDGNPNGSDPTGNGSDSALVTEAKTAVEAARKRPTELPISTPLKAKPATGKTVVYFQCEVAQCALQGKGLQAVTKALGWNYKVLNFQAANPATLITVMKTALQFNPTAVFFSGVPFALWKSMVPAYKKAGVYILPASVPGVEIDDTVITSLAAEALYTASGKLLADEVTALSGGKADILFATVPTYEIYKPLKDGFEAELKRICPACSSKTFEATLPQVTSNQLVPALVSELKRNPDIDYLVSVNGAFIESLPTALQSAGIESGKIKVLTHSGSASVQKLVKGGQFYSTTAFGFQYEAWLGIDAALRAMQGLPVGKEHQLLPLPLLTASNVGTPTDSYDLPTDYEAQFKKLWLVDN